MQAPRRRAARGFTPGVAEGTQAFGRARHCILVYLLGGPPQIDMWDLKPDAPTEIRGPFKPIQSATSGMRGGNLVGASDRTCAFPAELPVGPSDVVATIYHALGLEPRTLMVDPLNRPMVISEGKVISQLF